MNRIFSFNTAGLLWKYTAGTQDWRYRYSASGEREQKRNYAGTKTWTYYLLVADKLGFLLLSSW